MRKFIGSLLTVSLLCLLGAGSALAQEKTLKEHVTFYDDTMLGSTLIKRGEYLIKYDPQTGLASFMNGKKVVAQAKATVKVNDKKAEHDMLTTTTTSSGTQLRSIKLGGQREELVFSDTAAETSEAGLLDDGLAGLCFSEADLSAIAATDAVVPDVSSTEVAASNSDAVDVDAPEVNLRDDVDTTPSMNTQQVDIIDDVDLPDVEPFD